MAPLTTKHLPAPPDAVAPDGSDLRLLLSVAGGSMAHFGTHFQFRSFGPQPLQAIGVTMPPWPGDTEAIVVPGKWEATVGETSE